MSNFNMDPTKFKKDMGALAFGSALGAAARDYKSQMEAQDEAQAYVKAYQQVAIDEELGDEEALEKLQERRMKELRQEHEKKQEMARKGHGEYRHIGEDEFINEVTSSSLVACHFWHPEFPRSKIMDKHLEILARKYFDTKFIKIDAEKAAFFVAKLNIKMLPAVVFFKNGIAFDRVVGFGELGEVDDFPTSVLEERMLQTDAIKKKIVAKVQSDEEPDAMERRRVYASTLPKEDDDESSDFSD